MNTEVLYTFLSILTVSLISLAGIVFLIFTKSFFDKIQTLLVSFSIGSLLGGAVLHLIPESLEHNHSHGHSHGHENIAAILILVSIVVFFILEKYLHVHSHYYPDGKNVKSFGPLNIIADGFHNFLDGVLIAAAYKIDVSTGIVATMAVLAHELPQEIGDFAVLVQAGYSKKRALFFNFVSALASFIGAALVFILPGQGHELSVYVLPLAAGGFIYIALADLIPELNHSKSIKTSVLQLIFMLGGMTIMWFLLGLHSMHH